MGARAAQKAEVLNLDHALAFIERHGAVTESARRAGIPSLAEAIAGESIRGSWWSHPRGRTIFAITRGVRDAPDVLVCRLVDGKVTFVHASVWPALVRLADRFPRERLTRVREVHKASGKHVLEKTLFPDWVPAKIESAAKRMSERAALEQLKMLLPLAQ